MKIIKIILQSGRFEIPCRIYGDAPQTIICVNGALQSMAAWKSFISFFKQDYRVAVFDTPGQGRAKILAGSPKVSIDEQVSVLRSVVEATPGRQPVCLAAASWGGIVAVAYASRHPKKVAKIILGSFGAKPSKALLEMIKECQKLIEEENNSQLGHLVVERFGKSIPDSYKKKIIKQFQQMSQEQILSAYIHSGFVENAGHIDNFVDLNKIKARTLIVHGENDTILDREDMALAAARIQNCESKIVPGTDHFLHWENEDILMIYKDFLSR